MDSRVRLSVRIVGGLLAAVWLGAGVGALVFAALASRWLPAIVGLAALWYGLVWVRVAARGRLLTLREVVAPWRIARHPDV